jgi:APA family basic amino acid/polyamine antiporter
MKFFPLFPLIFILAYLFVGTSIAIDDPKSALTGIGVLAAFLLIYFIGKRFQSSANDIVPKA